MRRTRLDSAPGQSGSVSGQARGHFWTTPGRSWLARALQDRFWDGFWAPRSRPESAPARLLNGSARAGAESGGAGAHSGHAGAHFGHAGVPSGRAGAQSGRGGVQFGRAGAQSAMAVLINTVCCTRGATRSFVQLDMLCIVAVGEQQEFASIYMYIYKYNIPAVEAVDRE